MLTHSLLLATTASAGAYPIFCCCASALTATASNITATTMDSAAAFFISRLVLGVIYHADGSKEKRYLRTESEDVSLREKPQFGLRLN